MPESKASPSGGIASDRSSTTIATYRDYFKQYIIPQWRDVAIDNVKAVTVEKWLRSLHYADATKAKIRNHLSAALQPSDPVKALLSVESDRQRAPGIRPAS